MKSQVPQQSKLGRVLRGKRKWAVVLVAAMVALLVPAGAYAASPVLEFVTPGHTLPVQFTTESGEVNAEMAGFESLVRCTASHGQGEITGPRSTVSQYQLTGCTAGGQKCQSADAVNEEEITTGPIEADLVYIDQARHEVGVLLNPSGGTYISFECGGIHAEGQGSFLAPVSPIDQEATSFTATLNQLDSVQTPDEYENENGERVQAIPTGRRGSNKFVPTGVEAVFTVHPAVPVEVKAISSQESEAALQEEEVERQEDALKQLQATLKNLEEAFKKYEEHATQAGQEAKKHEEAANAQIAATAKKAQEAEVAAKKAQEEVDRYRASLARARLLARALRGCEKQPRNQRARCVASADKRYGAKAAKAARRRRLVAG
jgi:hypothetical protein